MRCFYFLVISKCFVIFLNKVKQKIPNEKILRTAINLRCLDTVFKKLNYSLLNTLNFRSVKFK